jgi:serine/threonine protein kinase
LKDLIINLLEKDPNKRPGLDYIFGHAWMKQHESTFGVSLAGLRTKHTQNRDLYEGNNVRSSYLGIIEPAMHIEPIYEARKGRNTTTEASLGNFRNTLTIQDLQGARGGPLKSVVGPPRTTNVPDSKNSLLFDTKALRKKQTQGYREEESVDYGKREPNGLNPKGGRERKREFGDLKTYNQKEKGSKTIQASNNVDSQKSESNKTKGSSGKTFQWKFWETWTLGCCSKR